MYGEHSVSGLASFPNSFLLRKKMVTRSTEKRLELDSPRDFFCCCCRCREFDEQRSLSGALDRARRQEENTIEYCLNGVTNSIKCSVVIQVDEYSLVIVVSYIYIYYIRLIYLTKRIFMRDQEEVGSEKLFSLLCFYTFLFHRRLSTVMLPFV